jgi:HD-GYP domain-containing protein (c-di-GMP phosphodiesterase class II)
MRSNRLYRNKLNLDDTKRQLMNGSGTQFDEKVVEIFINMLENEDLVVCEIESDYN